MSIERIYPDEIQSNETTGEESLQLHLERYQYAGSHLLPGSVADIACGAGYGSYLLATAFADKVKEIIAADIDDACIQYARTRYAHPNIRFVTTDAFSFEPGMALNNIVSLETIEHLSDPAAFVQQVSRHLMTGGRFIASAPVTPSMDANPYHLHDFTINSFKKIFLDAGLTAVNTFIQTQRYNPLPLLQRRENEART
ncbi:class I SAM-dependent methyltransferase [Paraflavitalea speifideaquila]|uniref:class I SAM-dependent methyltransferase n=1 Tax=Paraflavitalea speifideaquila TaxID=3076558 RepID=UPI0028EFA3FD|nr:class I SAM-dependent methyltransferase [Paraflavitalea speifideiaquila]